MPWAISARMTQASFDCGVGFLITISFGRIKMLETKFETEFETVGNVEILISYSENYLIFATG